MVTIGFYNSMGDSFYLQLANMEVFIAVVNDWCLRTSGPNVANPLEMIQQTDENWIILIF